MSDYSDPDMICPYYISTDKTSLTCQGVAEGWCNKRVFYSVNSKAKFTERYCKTFDWDSCPLADYLEREASKK